MSLSDFERLYENAPRIPHDWECQHQKPMGECGTCEEEVAAALKEAWIKGHMDIYTYKRMNEWQRRKIDEAGQ